MCKDKSDPVRGGFGAQKSAKSCEIEAPKDSSAIQRAQFKRLGVFGDWENPYLTLTRNTRPMNCVCSPTSLKRVLFIAAKKPVYWCIPCRTALAEAEVEYREHISPSVYVKFPVVGRPKTFVFNLDDDALDAAG